MGYHCQPVSINPLGDGAAENRPDGGGEARDPTVEELVAAHRFSEAARTAEADGKLDLAAKLYEKAWDFRAALAAARASGDLPKALSYAIDAHEEAAVTHIVAELCASQAGMREALEVLARRRRHAAAAPLAEQLGDLERATDLFRRAGNPLDAARLLEVQGRDRDAGQLLERALDLAVADEKAPLQLALGRILARRGAYSDATRLLQEARKVSQLRMDAQRDLVATLAAMGLRDAAREVLLDVRAHDASSGLGPVDLDGYLRTWRDQARVAPAHRTRDMLGGRYRLERLLGAGASGRVFLAFDEIAGRSVAVKMFSAANARGGVAYERFIREVRLASALRHPCLVEVYEVALDHGFLAMEFLSGGSLAERIASDDRITEVEVQRMTLDIIAGLEAAHHRGVIHRDIKPANVFFDARGGAKLGDFGVAHLVDFGQTQTGGLIGTLTYMSPEQITGSPISVAADLYSLGVTVFEALARRPPFLGPDFVAQHLGETPPMVSSVASDIAPGWDRIVAGLLVKDPTQRTQSLSELRNHVQALDLDRRPAHIRTSTIAENLETLAPATSEPRQRYQFETPLAPTAVSQLFRAVDTVLDRSVIIERYDTSDAAADVMARTRLLARAQSPFVQRALSLDVATRTAIFEAPSGATIAEAVPTLPPAERVRLLKRLARAIAAIHELGASHGAISATSVVVDDSLVPTLLTAGLGIAPALQPGDDVVAVVSVVAGIVGCEATFDAVARSICSEVGARLPRCDAPFNGESLYVAADALDVAVLSAVAKS